MNITKLLIVVILLATLVGPHLIDGEASAQAPKGGKEYVYYSITLTTGHLLVSVSDADSFLANPVGALRAEGIAVPQLAEQHWRSLTVALRRLSNPRLPQSPGRVPSRSSIGALKNQIARLELRGGSIPVVGDWNGDGTITSGDFMSDPVRTLRGQGVKVAPADEPALRQLVQALRELRRIYATPNRAGLNQSELTTTTPQTAAQRRRIIEGYSAEFYAGSRLESGTVVGTCNSSAGCNALKAACSTMSKHDFKTIEGGGMCVDQANGTSTGYFFLRNTNTASPSTGGKNEVGAQPSESRRSGDTKFNDITIHKAVDDAKPALNCEGTVLCSKVKKACATLGGTYTQINKLEGTCRH